MLHSDNEPMNKHICLCFNDIAYSEFNKAFFNEVNVIMTTYSAVANC